MDISATGPKELNVPSENRTIFVVGMPVSTVSYSVQ